MSGRASVGGDEAKVVELADGRILMSIRHGGNRWYNISNDGGVTWQANPSTWYDITAPACNGDIIRYSSVNDGGDKNRILHSVPTGTDRKNVTVFVSYDEGQTWPTSRCIVPYSSAYSSLCILPDNTIGIYVEEDFYTGKDNYSTVFYNFSLEWLTKGEDKYEGINEIMNKNNVASLNVYPNPTNADLNIEAEGLKIINIYNVQGQLLSSLQVDNEMITIDVTNYETGVYFVEGVDEHFGRKVARVVIK